MPTGQRSCGSRALKTAGYAVVATYHGNDAVADKFKAHTGIPARKWDVSNYKECAEGLSKVADEILKFRERVGDFGTLLYAGKDWRDPKLAKRSMTLLAEKVLPKVNAAIKKASKKS